MKGISLPQSFTMYMKNNILNLSKLFEGKKKNYDIYMKNQSFSIRDQHVNLITNVPITRNIMTLKKKIDVVKCLKSCVNGSSWIWHLRFGHLNLGGLKLLSKKIQ